MVLHLGGDVVIPVEYIIAIVNLESTEQTYINREFLKTAAEEGFIRKISDDKPKSFILAEIDKKSVVFMSPISSTTLLKRSSFVEGMSIKGKY